MSQARALITGLNGFTGSYLAAELEQAGYTVYGLNRTIGHPNSPNEFAADITDIEGLRKVIKAVRPQLVAHLAGIAFAAHDDVAQIYQANLIGTRQLLQALSESDCDIHCVLLASSASVYGQTDIDSITETTPTQPTSDYGVSKLAMEQMAKLWMKKLPIVITRPFNYTGLGQAQHFLIPKIIHHFKNKLPSIALGNLDLSRDFSDVRTVARAYRLLLEKGPAGETVNIGSGRATHLRDLIKQISALTGHDAEITLNNNLVRVNETKTMRSCNDKLESLIGPLSHAPLQATLQWMINENPAQIA